MKTKGFTLIETVIYAAIISMMIGFALATAYQLIQGSQNLNDKAIAEEEANFIIRKIEWTLTGLVSVNLPSAGSSAPTLSVNKISFASNPLVFSADDERNILLQRGLDPATLLNSQNVAVNNLNFTHLAAVGNTPEAVKASFQINGNSYETTIYVRK